MRVEIGARCLIGPGVFNLLINRIGIDHDAHRTAQVFLAQPGRAAQIDQPVRLGVEGAHPLARQPVVDVVDCVPIGPAPGKAVPFHRLAQIGNVIAAIHDDAADPRIVGIGAVILDIPGLKAELFEAGEVIDRLPGDPGERHLTDEMEEDDSAAFAHEGPGSS
jgi:hypothetical protein